MFRRPRTILSISALIIVTEEDLSMAELLRAVVLLYTNAVILPRTAVIAFKFACSYQAMLTVIPRYTMAYAPSKPYPTSGDDGWSCRKSMSGCKSKGWQIVKPTMHNLGSMAAVN